MVIYENCSKSEINRKGQLQDFGKMTEKCLKTSNVWKKIKNENEQKEKIMKVG